MGVFEDLQDQVLKLDDRIKSLEGYPSGVALKNYIDDLTGRTTELSNEHKALVHRIHDLEGDSNKLQHGEIQALGRRVDKVEEREDVVRKLVTSVEDLHKILEETNTRRDEQISALQEKMDRTKVSLLAYVETLTTDVKTDVQGIKEGREWWKSLSWWKRVWLVFTGGMYDHNP